MKARIQKGDREKKGGDILKLKKEVKALAKVVKVLAIEPKLLYSNIAANKALRVLVVLSKKIKEIVIALREEIKA